MTVGTVAFVPRLSTFIYISATVEPLPELGSQEAQRSLSEPSAQVAVQQAVQPVSVDSTAAPRAVDAAAPTGGPPPAGKGQIRILSRAAVQGAPPVEKTFFSGKIGTSNDPPPCVCASFSFGRKLVQACYEEGSSTDQPTPTVDPPLLVSLHLFFLVLHRQITFFRAVWALMVNRHLFFLGILVDMLQVGICPLDPPSFCPLALWRHLWPCRSPLPRSRISP